MAATIESAHLSWAEFVERYWEKRPVVLKRPFGAALAERGDIFSTLVAASERYRARSVGDNDVRFFIDDARLLDADRLLPIAGDGSVTSYGRRVARALEGRRFTLIVNPFQIFSAELWAEMREFLRGLYAALGAIPAGTTDAHLIVGDYEASPFGLHKDPAGVFTFVVEGFKRMLVWPFEEMRSLTRDPDAAHKQVNLREIDYDRFRDKAIALEGEAGDVLYWPSTYWHAAESKGELHMTLHLANYLDGRPHRSLVRLVERMMDERLGAGAWEQTHPFRADQLAESAAQMPRGMLGALDALRQLAQDAELERRTRLKWLCRTTGFGFEHVPPPRAPSALGDDDVICADPRYPVVWIEGREHEILCSANGHAFGAPAHPHLLRMLERLNTGGQAEVGDLARRFSGDVTVGDVEFTMSPDEVRALLSKLWSMRAVRRLSEPR